MSSILKALRKLEEEKAVIGDGGIDIAHDILKHTNRNADRNKFWPLLSAVLFLLLLCAGGVLFITTHPDPVVQGQIAPRVAQTVAAPLPSSVQSRTPPEKETVTTAAIPVATVSQPTVPEKISGAEKIKPEPSALRPNGIPFLKLTGIAYQKKPVERIAIINDLPVMQGTAIEGAQVIKILTDKVILSWQGKRFVQKLNKTRTK